MEAIVPKRPTLWTSLVEAVRGSHQDYTTGSLNRAILLRAVPMVLEMVLESLLAVVDVWLFEIPLANWIPLHMRSNGVFFSIAIAESAMAVTSAVRRLPCAVSSTTRRPPIGGARLANNRSEFLYIYDLYLRNPLVEVSAFPTSFASFLY